MRLSWYSLTKIESTKHFMGMHVVLGLPQLRAWELFVCTWHMTLVRLCTEADLGSNTRSPMARCTICLLQTKQKQVEPVHDGHTKKADGYLLS